MIPCQVPLCLKGRIWSSSLPNYSQDLQLSSRTFSFWPSILILVQKLKHLQSDKPNFESTFTDSPSAKVGDPLTLSTWRSNSNNLDEIKSKQSSPSESITLSPPSIQPNKIQTQGIQPGKIQAMSSHQSETVDDFSNDFLADLLPGLVLGGASAPEPKVRFYWEIYWNKFACYMALIWCLISGQICLDVPHFATWLLWLV